VMTPLPITRPSPYIARISDDRKDGASVETQLEDCRALVATEGWEAIEFVDKVHLRLQWEAPTVLRGYARQGQKPVR